jgi:hypothetical protein
MYGENGAAMRTELAVLLRQHRVLHRLGEPDTPERSAHSVIAMQYRQSIVLWCSQAMHQTAPMLFSNLPPRPANPFRAPEGRTTGAGELSRAIDHARSQSSHQPANSALLSRQSDNPVIERWRHAARAAVLAEHDTGGDTAARFSAPQAQTLAADVAAIMQALIVLDQRYRNAPGWEPLAQPTRLGWAALATAMDVGLGQPDYSIDQIGWRPKTKVIDGPARPGILGVLQAEHNLVVRLKSFPNPMNLRRIVDSQKLLSQYLAPYAARFDETLAERWTERSATYALIQQQLRDIGGRIGRGEVAAAEGANAVSRLRALPGDAIVEPRILAGFELLFHRLDRRVAAVIEDGVSRAVFVQRVTVPRVAAGTGQLVQPIRERFMPVTSAADLDVVRTVRARLRVPAQETTRGPGASRADLSAALLHRPTQRGCVEGPSI